MPLTASKTDADTIAAVRLVKNGLVPPAKTVSFMMPIHCRTGSGVAASADGREAPNRNTRTNTVTTKRVTALILLMAIPPVLSVTSSAPSPGEKAVPRTSATFSNTRRSAPTVAGPALARNGEEVARLCLVSDRLGH
jgi:hypothetical protein